MATFNAAVAEVIELYFQENFAEMEAKLEELYKQDPVLYKQAQVQLEDLIAEQHYLDEGEELNLW